MATSVSKPEKTFLVLYLGYTRDFKPSFNEMCNAMKDLYIMRKPQMKKLPKSNMEINEAGITLTSDSEENADLDKKVFNLKHIIMSGVDKAKRKLFAFYYFNKSGANFGIECHVLLCKKAKYAKQAAMAVSEIFDKNMRDGSFSSSSSSSGHRLDSNASQISSMTAFRFGENPIQWPDTRFKGRRVSLEPLLRSPGKPDNKRRVLKSTCHYDRCHGNGSSSDRRDFVEDEYEVPPRLMHSESRLSLMSYMPMGFEQSSGRERSRQGNSISQDAGDSDSLQDEILQNKIARKPKLSNNSYLPMTFKQTSKSESSRRVSSNADSVEDYQEELIQIKDLPKECNEEKGMRRFSSSASDYVNISYNPL